MSIVLFSGGCDSTLVLYEKAMEAVRSNLYSNNIIALSISHDQIMAQKEQKAAREKIKEEFEKRELNRYIQYIEVDITQKGGSIGNISGLMQPNIWLSIASLYCTKDDNIFLGYHTGDDYWQYKTEAETAFINFLKVQDKAVTLNYPLRTYTKCDIIKKLKERGLYDFCWYCELPTEGKVCDFCTPCITHRTALWQIDNCFKKYSEVSPVAVLPEKIEENTIAASELNTPITGS